ncbi:hypothetical protein B7494_g6290 [Chlorociboria aeruginascens]|nr:hypothetical protein B7494_g6290 [Chlorociboria aeruginascens]
MSAIQQDKLSQATQMKDWVVENGGFLHPKVDLFESLEKGLSFRGKKGIPANSKIVECPQTLGLSYLNTIIPEYHNSPHARPFPTSFLEPLKKDDPNVIGNFFLVQQYLLGEKSFWWLYIRTLPPPNQTFGTPAWWPEEDQMALQGTNLEPALIKQGEIWDKQWLKGLNLLKNDYPNWEDYTSTLYKWAASVFGSRSFRPSLTITIDALKSSHYSPDLLELISRQVWEDSFSILFPLVDIGNHCGLKQLDWRNEASGFGLILRKETKYEDEEIFNYYGEKSNTELLLAYGFILPNNDVLNLKLTPRLEALQLRRSQSCHVIPDKSQSDGEFLFQAYGDSLNRMKGDKWVRVNGDSRLEIFQYFSEGLIDLIYCMVANTLESTYIAANPLTCPEKDVSPFESPLCRATLRVIYVLYEKLTREKRRIDEREPQEATNINQKLVFQYRNCQRYILTSSLYKINDHLISCASQSSFGLSVYGPYLDSDRLPSHPPINQNIEILSLETAYGWLRIHYPILFDEVAKAISNDQDEPLPLDWAILFEEWDYAYWIVWIYILVMLWLKDGEAFRSRHKILRPFLDEIVDTPIASLNSQFHGSSDEKSTVYTSISPISSFSLPSSQPAWLQGNSDVPTQIINLASSAVKEYTFDMDCYHTPPIPRFSYYEVSPQSHPRRWQQQIEALVLGLYSAYQDRIARMDEKSDEKPSPTESPRVKDVAVQHFPSTYIKPQGRKPHDPAVTFEEYYYYAQRTREEEKTIEAPSTNWKHILLRKKTETEFVLPAPNLEESNFTSSENRLEISDEEWTNASRAFRTASWGACFYLITTDILGPYGVGFALGTLGWGPGIAFFTIFGFFAGYSGYLIWRVFLGIDSHEFPAKNYGDLGFRTWGTTARYTTNIMQAIGLILLLGQVTIQFGENLSLVSKFKLCYIVCPLLFVIAGFFITQIRTLKSYGLVANMAVWLNLLVIFITMGVIANSPPNYAISVLGSAGSAVDPDSIKPDDAGNYPPVMHYSNLPPNGLVGSINGLLQGVLAYAGAQLFVEFLAEMRRPYDFIKAMWGAQFFIYSVYLIYGCFVYHFQGQYSFAPSYMGVSPYGWQTAGNMISLIAALIAAGLYGNIGIKVLYNNILMDLFNAPPLITTRGKFLYAAIVPLWWIVAFIIAAAIPDYFGFVAVMSASTLLNLTYTLPPFFALGFDIQKNALRPELGEGFDPTTGQVVRSGGTVTRWVRGFFSGGLFQVALNVWHAVYFLASLSMCGLGMYSAIMGMIEVFKNPQD